MNSKIKWKFAAMVIKWIKLFAMLLLLFLFSVWNEQHNRRGKINFTFHRNYEKHLFKHWIPFNLIFNILKWHMNNLRSKFMHKIVSILLNFIIICSFSLCFFFLNWCVTFSSQKRFFFCTKNMDFDNGAFVTEFRFCCSVHWHTHIVRMLQVR